MKDIDLVSETAIKIVESSIELFNEFGYSGTSISDIAKRAGFSKGILYHYFSSKDELYLFCLRKCINDFIDFMEKRVHKSTLDKNSLLEIVELRFKFFDQNPQYKNLFHNIISSKPGNLADKISEIRQRLTENNMKLLESISKEIKFGKGVLDSDVILFITMMQNSSTFLLDSNGNEERKKEVIDSVVRLTNIFLNGMKNDLI